MEPDYRDGDVLVIDPGRPPSPGDAVVLWPVDERRRLILASGGAAAVRADVLETREFVSPDALAALHVVAGVLPAESPKRRAS